MLQNILPSFVIVTEHDHGIMGELERVRASGDRRAAGAARLGQLRPGVQGLERGRRHGRSVEEEIQARRFISLF